MSAKARSKVGRKVRDNRPCRAKSSTRAVKKKSSAPAATVAAPKKSAPLSVRDPSGKFVKGFSGNIHGQPIISKEVRELARVHGPEAIARLVHWMRCEDPASSIAATKILLDRGYGKSVQLLASPNGAPLVSLTIGAPIATAEEAARVYAELCRDPSLDISAVKFAAPKPALIEQRSNTKGASNAKQ